MFRGPELHAVCCPLSASSLPSACAACQVVSRLRCSASSLARAAASPRRTLRSVERSPGERLTAAATGAPDRPSTTSLDSSLSQGISSLPGAPPPSTSRSTSGTPLAPTAADAAPSFPGRAESSLSTSSSPPQRSTFDEIMAFDGIPELVNGRLAMLGFLWGTVTEIQDGVSFLDQAFDPNQYGLFYSAASFVLVTAASVAPLLRTPPTSNASPEFLFFTEQAELYNGRLAMVGLVGVFLLEYIAGIVLGGK